MAKVLANIVVAFLSAGFGSLVGGYVGYRGALKVQREEDKARCRAAGRALLAEMLGNHQALGYVGEHPPAGFSQSVLKAQLPLAAHLLDWDQLQTVLKPYLTAAEPLYALSIADELRSGKISDQNLLTKYPG